jgi:tRNA threonylcarbamoyladenosine biosynthesis protein TsaB
MFLAINTSTRQYSLALLDKQGYLWGEYTVMPSEKNFSRFLLGFDHLLSPLDIQPQALEAVIIVQGPGSYTGLRVGMATAKAICQGLDIPIIGVSSLDTMANQLAQASLPICAMIESRKGEVFAAVYQWQMPEGLVPLNSERTVRISELAALIEGPTLVIGNDYASQAPHVTHEIGQEAILVPPFMWCLKASSAGMLGLKRYEKGQRDNLRDLTPSYLRPPDIRPNPYPLHRSGPSQRP